MSNKNKETRSIEAERAAKLKWAKAAHTARAHADKLAAALKRSMSWLSSYPGNGADAVYEQARAALAAYDASKGGAQ